MFRTTMKLGLLVLGLTMVGESQAALILGSTANGSLKFGTNNGEFFTPTTATIVDPGVEFHEKYGDPISADLSPTTLTLSGVEPTRGGVLVNATSHYLFSGLQADNGESITGLILASSSGYTVSSYSFTGNSISVDIAPYVLSGPATFSAVFDITTAVPEPASIISVSIAGLAGVGLWLRRRKRTA